MKFEASDRAKLLKIGVLSLLDLALVLPKGFEDTTIAKSPREGQVCINVKITSLASRPGMLTALAFCEQWQSSVKIVIFNAKSWHYGAFKTGKEMAIYGLCSYAYFCGDFWINDLPRTKGVGAKPIYRHLFANLKSAVVPRLCVKNDDLYATLPLLAKGKCS